MNSTKALSRTWQTVTTYRECGVIVDVTRNTVTLSRATLCGPLLATIDGQAAQVDRAARLHKIMGRIGLCNPDHYGNARRALDREVFSLASLTEQEARRVWAHLCRTFPAIRHAV